MQAAVVLRAARVEGVHVLARDRAAVRQEHHVIVRWLVPDDFLERKRGDGDAPGRVALEHHRVVPLLVPHLLPLVHVAVHAPDVVRDVRPALGQGVVVFASLSHRAGVVEIAQAQRALRRLRQRLLEVAHRVLGILKLVGPVVRVDAGRDGEPRVHLLGGHAVLLPQPLLHVLGIFLVVLGVDADAEDVRARRESRLVRSARVRIRSRRRVSGSGLVRLAEPAGGVRAPRCQTRGVRGDRRRGNDLAAVGERRVLLVRGRVEGVVPVPERHARGPQQHERGSGGDRGEHARVRVLLGPDGGHVLAPVRLHEQRHSLVVAHSVVVRVGRRAMRCGVASVSSFAWRVFHAGVDVAPIAIGRVSDF